MIRVFEYVKNPKIEVSIEKSSRLLQGLGNLYDSIKRKKVVLIVWRLFTMPQRFVLVVEDFLLLFVLHVITAFKDMQGA